MAKILKAFFDGTVLRPDEPADLKPNTRYVLTIEPEDEHGRKGQDTIHPLTAIGKLATDMGVTDLSSRHDFYAHGRLNNNSA